MQRAIWQAFFFGILALFGWVACQPNEADLECLACPCASGFSCRSGFCVRPAHETDAEGYCRAFIAEGNTGDGGVSDSPVCTIAQEGAERPCTYVLAPCTTQGKQRCTQGAWGLCEPLPEACNGKDDNCDGKVDEDGACLYSFRQALVAPPKEVLAAAWFSPTQGIALQKNSEIRRTLNAGLTWESVQKPGVSPKLQKVAANPWGLALVIGEKATLWRSLDAGASFQSLTMLVDGAPLGEDLVALDLHEEVALIADATGALYLSVDGAQTWDRVPLPVGLPFRWQSIAFYAPPLLIDPLQMEAAAVDERGLILRLSIPRATTASPTPPTLTPEILRIAGEPPLQALLWLSANTLLAASSDGRLFRSNDRGKAWSPVVFRKGGSGLPFPSPPSWRALHRLTEEIVLLAAEKEWFLSFDQGDTLHPRSSPSPILAFSSPFPTFFVGFAQDAAWIYRGSSALQTLQTPLSIQGLAFHPETRVAFAVGSSRGRGRLLRSKDQGRTWEGSVLPIPKTLPPLIQVRGVGFTSSCALALGHTSQTPLPDLQRQGAIFLSEDRGQVWRLSEVRPELPLGLAFPLDPLQPTLPIAVFVGDKETIFRSQECGKSGTWTAGSITFPPGLEPSQSPLTSVSFLQENGVAVGYGGRTFWSSDTGITWTAKPVTTPILSSVLLFEQAGKPLAIAVGEDGQKNGVILRSLNLGQTWLPALTLPSPPLLSVAKAEGNELIAIGENGAVFQSSNFGQTWIASPTSPLFRSSAAPLPASRLVASASSLQEGLWIAGDTGGIAKRETGAWSILRWFERDLAFLLEGPGRKVLVGSQMAPLEQRAGDTRWQAMGSEPLPTPLGKPVGIATDGISFFLPFVAGQLWGFGSPHFRWTPRSTPSPNLSSIAITSSKAILLSGFTPPVGELLLSKDEGQTFSKATAPLSLPQIFRVACLSDLCLAGGVGGFVYRSTTQGQTWDETPLLREASGAAITQIALADAQIFVLAASPKKLIVSQDGGSLWTSPAAPPFQEIADLKAFRSASCPRCFLAIDIEGRCLLSLDGGLRWSLVSPALGLPLSSIHLSNDDATLVGADGALLRFQLPFFPP